MSAQAAPVPEAKGRSDTDATSGGRSSAPNGRAGLGRWLVRIALGLICLVWTVLMVWGSVWALTGRSRVMLLVGGSIALAFTLFGLIGNSTSGAMLEGA